jgi:hypothetical protein
MGSANLGSAPTYCVNCARVEDWPPSSLVKVSAVMLWGQELLKAAFFRKTIDLAQHYYQRWRDAFRIRHFDTTISATSCSEGSSLLLSSPIRYLVRLRLLSKLDSAPHAITSRRLYSPSPTGTYHSLRVRISFSGFRRTQTFGPQSIPSGYGIHQDVCDYTPQVSASNCFISYS